MANDVTVSKFLSLVLRHDPAEAGITLDENGWTGFDALARIIETRFKVSRDDLERIVAENPKKRFTLQDGRIRAAQGHSVDVDLALKPVVPPETLFHGTKLNVLPAILAEGLTAQSRQHVHLSRDIKTALIVARRRSGQDAILKVASALMAKDGIAFYQSENGVWLTDKVEPRYLTLVSGNNLT